MASRWKAEFGLEPPSGFDEFLALLGGRRLLTTRAIGRAQKSRAAGGLGDLWCRTLAPIERAAYLTTLLSDKAVEI